MKKIYTLLSAILLLSSFAAKSQNVLLYQDFELTKFYYLNTSLDTLNSSDGGVMPGNVIDSLWYSFDQDGNVPTGTHPNRNYGWSASYPISTVDQYVTGYQRDSCIEAYMMTSTDPDTNTVMLANSWTNLGDASPESNWLITPNIQLGDHDTLFWKSAPAQTPRYLDGYEILLSTVSNDDAYFTHVLFTAAQMVGTPPASPDTTFADYTFLPAAGTGAWIHGADGNDMDIAGTTAPVSKRGRLHAFSVPLDAYANMNVFIGFHHTSADDNAITLDDVMVRGSAANTHAGIAELNDELKLSVYPNPAHDNTKLIYTTTSETPVTINVFDITGKLVSSQNEGTVSKGHHTVNINAATMANGFYTISVQTSYGKSTTKLIIQ